MRAALLGLLILSIPASADDAAKAKARWAGSGLGPMLERLLPPTFAASQLPDPESAGAQLMLRYCVQCHNLPNPAMHDAKRWPAVLERMLPRMMGKGNLGAAMKEMMAGAQAPTEQERQTLLAYLRRHAQKPIDPQRYPDLSTPAGEPFRLACEQCHVLPDPQRYAAAQWPKVVARMQENMEWMNRVVGSTPAAGEPQLRVDMINAFLTRHARR